MNLAFAAYDPVFYLHHSNVDRIYAFWQKLQKIRGKSSEAKAKAKEFPLPPFTDPTVNPFYQVTGVDPTQRFSLNYEKHFNYKERRKIKFVIYHEKYFIEIIKANTIFTPSLSMMILSSMEKHRRIFNRNSILTAERRSMQAS